MQAREYPYPGYKNMLFRNLTLLVMQCSLFKCGAGNRVSITLANRDTAAGFARISLEVRRKHTRGEGKKREKNARTLVQSE